MEDLEHVDDPADEPRVKASASEPAGGDPRVKASASEPAGGDPDEVAGDDEVAEETQRLRQLINRRRPAAGPATERWALGMGDVLTQHPRVPKRLHGLLRRFNRYGGVAISPQAIEFDGDEVQWSDVIEIRTRNLVEFLVTDAMDEQVVAVVPLRWFPGRKRVVNAIGRALLVLVVATAKETMERDFDLRVPAEVEYRGRLGRARTLSPAVLGTLTLAEPAVSECLVSTARTHDIPIRAADDGMADTQERVRTIKAKLTELEARLPRRS